LIPPGSTTILLVDPSLPENIGAAARAMKNMGFASLRIVYTSGTEKHLCDTARRMSAGAEDILETARAMGSLREAVADLNLVVGTTARHGKGRHPILEPRTLPDRLGDYPEDMRLGIVFGREDRGLSNPELDLCNLLLTIPVSSSHSSLNLAQAVLLVCYELALKPGNALRKVEARHQPATGEEVEGLFGQAREVLLRIGFLDPQNPDRILRALRRVLGRAGMDSREVKIFRGILRRMDWYAGVMSEKSKDL
jgi:tRNA/rRNA methyltransferase